ncbi:hypothetical protein J4573_39115 [Actinomadura barringtoniae]|uniref:Uncharacterized protein n=1 Tax=Actinomadura barringtoniae TaxID=1427535 RepID=A0A939T7I7_9ACTN|nr:hypothetical protein [Actinomadura barringtoniae]MBO2453158.1 hypothetical protein [Actinomadura barringtoniae]
MTVNSEDIEDRLRTAFGWQADQVGLRPDPYAENLRRTRTSRIRRRATFPAVALATAAAAAAPFLMPWHEDQPSLNPTGGPGDLVVPSSMVRIKTGLPHGARFQAEVLGTDGSVLGRSADAAVWKAGPKGGKPSSTGVRSPKGILLTGRGLLGYAVNEPGNADAFNLMCRDSSGKTHTASPQGVDPAQPVWTDGGRIIGSDVMTQPFSATCRGPLKILAQQWTGSWSKAVAFSDPTIFYVDPTSHRDLREIDAVTGRVGAHHKLPAGVRKMKPIPNGARVDTQIEQIWWAAATPNTFAWAADGALRVTPRKAWNSAPTPITTSLPRPIKGGRTQLTAGSRLVVYSTAPTRGSGESVLYDLKTHQLIRWHGEAYTSGDWLIWRDGTDYRLARVR